MSAQGTGTAKPSNSGSRRQTFLALHDRRSTGGPLLLTNPPDAGIARVLELLGCEAVATSSAALAGTNAQLDGLASLEQTLDHAQAIAAAVTIPVHVDFENGFAHGAAEVADNVSELARTGVSGVSIEDFDRVSGIYELDLAVERVGAAAAVAVERDLVLTARAEGLLHGESLPTILERLRLFAEAGADVVFAPGLRDSEAIRAAVAATPCPLNVLLLPGVPTLAQLGECGVARVSTGSLFHRTLLAQVEPLLNALRAGDDHIWVEQARGAKLASRAFANPSVR